MSTPRHPTRLATYSENGVFYPRELVETGGNLYIINADGSATLLNDKPDGFKDSVDIKLTGDITGQSSGTNGWDIATTLKNSGVTAGSYGLSADATPDYSGTLNIPYFTVDAKGRITAASNKKLTLPALKHPSISVGTDSSGNSTPDFGGAFTVVESITRDTNGHITKIGTKSVTIPALRHIGITLGTDSTDSKSLTHGGTFTAIDGVTRDANGHVTKINTKTFTMPNIEHITVTKGTDSTNSVSPGYGESFTAIDGVTRDANGHVTKINTKTVKLPALQHPAISTTTDSADAKTLTHSGTFTAIDSITKDSNGHITKINTKTFTMPDIEHIDVGVVDDETDTQLTPAHGGTFTIVDSINRDDHGHVTNIITRSVKLPVYSNASASAAGLMTAAHYTKLEGLAASTTAPKAAGTASAGESEAWARGDHVHPLQTSVSGNAGTANAFAAKQTVALTGDVTGSASSTAGWSVAATLAASGVTAGSYGLSANATPDYSGTFNVPYITVDAKGRVTAASNKTITIPALKHPTITASTNTTSTASPGHGGTFTAIDSITKDANGHVTKINTKTVTLPGVEHPTISVGSNTTSTAAPDFGGTFTAIDSITKDANGHVTKVNTKTVTIPALKHVTITTSTDTTSTAAPAHGGTFTSIDSVTRDANGHVTKVNTKTVTLPTYGAASASSNGLMSSAHYTKLEGVETGANKTTVDTAMSSSSTNPVQNKVVNTALAAKASTTTYTATIGTTWTGSAAPYTQTITVTGVTADDNPIVDIKPDTTYETAETQLTAWSNVYRITTAANSITVYAKEKTETAIPIQIKCVR